MQDHVAVLFGVPPDRETIHQILDGGPLLEDQGYLGAWPQSKPTKEDPRLVISRRHDGLEHVEVRALARAGLKGGGQHPAGAGWIWNAD